MKPLLVLLAITGITLIVLKAVTGAFNLPLSARTGMSVMLLFTALGHFIYTEGMVMMLPGSIPFRREMVYGTAILEIAGAIGLHIPQLRPLTAWLLILFLVMVLPANIRASLDHLSYQSADYNGPGPGYLWFRIPLQLLFIIWIYISAIRYG